MWNLKKLAVVDSGVKKERKKERRFVWGWVWNISYMMAWRLWGWVDVCKKIRSFHCGIGEVANCPAQKKGEKISFLSSCSASSAERRCDAKSLDLVTRVQMYGAQSTKLQHKTGTRSIPCMNQDPARAWLTRRLQGVCLFLGARQRIFARTSRLVRLYPIPRLSAPSAFTGSSLPASLTQF